MDSKQKVEAAAEPLPQRTEPNFCDEDPQRCSCMREVGYVVCNHEPKRRPGRPLLFAVAERESKAEAALRVLEQANVRIADGLGERCIRALLDAGLINSKIGTDIPVSELLRFAEALLAQAAAGVTLSRPVRSPEFQEVSWGVDAAMRPVIGQAVSECAFREWCRENGIMLADDDGRS